MSTERDNDPIIDARVRVDSLPATGRSLIVETSPEEREALAERLDILSVEAFGAKLLARPLKGGIEVSGTLVADVTQACVVSFEPVPEHIEEKMFRLFLQGAQHDPDPTPGAEVYVDLERDDLPDHFDGPEADLSEWLIETLSLALDPYPRKPGVELESTYTDDSDEPDSPFEALKALKTTKK